MAIKKIKISELPKSQTLDGFKTIGVNSENESVSVDLSFVNEAAVKAENATAETIEATAQTENATNAANVATDAANAATNLANIAAENANTKAAFAQTQGNYAKKQGDNIDSLIETAVAALVNGAPETLDTLNELAAALGNDPNFAATIANEMGKRVTVENFNAALEGKIGNMPNYLEAGYDLNTIAQSGFYQTFNGVNAPIQGDIYIEVIKAVGDNTYLLQKVTALGSNNTPNKYFHRIGLANSSFSDWVEILHVGNFNPGPVHGIWKGTQAEYDAISAKNVNTLYIIL